MYTSRSGADAPKFSVSRGGQVAALITVVFALAALALSPARAHAAFTISAWDLTPSTTQAGGHPNVTFHLDPDAVAGDATSDDLKTVQVEFSAGMLANPEAVTSANRCTATKFAADTCPSASQIGTISVQYRRSGAYYTMSGTMYELTTDPSSVITFGFIVRPSGYKKIFLKSSKVSGIATVRTGIDADYGVTALIDNIPRTLTTTGGTVQNVTISNVSVALQSKANASKSGPYFTFNPTRCTAAATRATMTSYLGVSIQKTSSFTPTGCSSVPFAPTFSVTPTSTVAGAATGLSATVTVPTADATIQQSHVKTIQTTLPTGTGLNFTNIGAVAALCSDAQLSTDTCPAGSKIGTTSASVPFLPPTMTGGIYLMSRSSSITFGYTLHGSGNTLVTLKGSAVAVDADSDGVADFVQASLIDLPQAPFSSATLNFTSALINNPAGPCASPSTISASIAGWSGAVVTRTSSYTLTNCPTIPNTNLISGPLTPTSNNTPTFTFNADMSGVTFECAIDGAMFSSCVSPYTPSAPLIDGSHMFQVRAVNSSGPDPTPATETFVVDTTPPVVTIASPTNGSSVGTTVNLTFTATDATTSVTGTTCKLDSGSAVACTSPQSYSGLAIGAHTLTVAATDSAGNVGAASTTITVCTSCGGRIDISSPSAGSFINSTSVTVTFSASGVTNVRCAIDGGAAAACSSPTTYTGLSQGSHTVVVSGDGSSGAVSAAVTFTVDSVPPVVTITSPANGSSVGTSATLTFTAADATTSVSGTTCKLDSGSAVACTSPQTYSGLAVGTHVLTVSATDSAGNAGSASTTFSALCDFCGHLSITSAPGPATANPTPTFAFTITPSSSGVTFECAIDAGAYAACTSPYTPPALTDQTIHTFCVRDVTGAGADPSPACTNFLVDTRPFKVNAAVSAQSNTLTAAADVNKPAAHPDISSSMTMEGADDAKSVVLLMPHGLSGSLASIPYAGTDSNPSHTARRCTTAQATAGTCPNSSIVGSGSGTIVVTDSATQLTVNGTAYLTDPFTSSSPAGVAIKATVPGGRGDIIATGDVDLINNAQTQRMTINNVPNTTTTGVPFHGTSLNVVIKGDTGGAAAPFITNGSFCGTPGISGSGTFAPYNATTNKNGYLGPFQQFTSTVTSYGGSTISPTAAYAITGCAAGVPPFAPTLTQAFDNQSAGAPTGVTATMDNAPGSSTIQRVVVKEPPKIGADMSSFGDANDQCPTGAATYAAVGVGNTPFNKSSCPSQSKIGQMKIVTPSLVDPVIADVYLIYKTPLPWLGVHIDPTISPSNPQGVTADFVGSTATPFVDTTCSSNANGGPCGGPGTGICDVDTEVCQSQIQVSFAIMPDMPITKAVIYLGHNADGSSLGTRLSVSGGGALPNTPMVFAAAGDNTCSTGVDSDAVTAGTPFTQSAVATFTAWSRTTSAGGASATTTSGQAIDTSGSGC